MQKEKPLTRDDRRIIIHFDYDCFYAAVVENENPALKSVPLAIQQKQIIVTCNYEARRRGLYKLQLITEAKRMCPDVVIVLGEDISRFRDASKELCAFVTSYVWSKRAERLGFDEIWLDCTDMIDYNMSLLNYSNLQRSFFCLDKTDPTIGFEFDAAAAFGPTFPMRPATRSTLSDIDQDLQQRLILGSHLARQLRHELEYQKGYTATVGIATNKILSKLVGNVNKPMNQTTMLPPLAGDGDRDGVAIEFMDSHEIGQIPGIGFKLAQKVRAHVLGRPADFEAGLVYGQTKEKVTVRDVRVFPGIGPQTLEDVLSGPGSQKGIGGKMWELLHGIDVADVGIIKRVPSQISQEDSYMKHLNTFDEVRHQLVLLSDRLIRRMHVDLTESDDGAVSVGVHWLAHPKTLRLSTRPRPPRNADGTRTRTFHRISRSVPLPNFVFGLAETSSVLAEKLVEETLVPMFRKLHHERNGWDLSLINVAVTNMVETAADTKFSQGRDIGRMFQRQDEVLKDFRLVDTSGSPDRGRPADHGDPFHEPREGDGDLDHWESDEEDDVATHVCPRCHVSIPSFARDAHQRFHALG